MKTTITSNGKQVNIQLEAENPLEKAIVDAIDLYKQCATVYRATEGILEIHVDTDINPNIKSL